MKKIISIRCVLGRVLFETVGQNISSGARAGLNLANMTGDIEDIAMKTSFHLGGYVNIGFSEALSLQSELLFNTVGVKEDGGDGKLNLNYISIPIMVLYNVSEMITIQAGRQLGFLLSAKAKDGDDESDIKELFKGSDLAFNLGLGADFGQFNAAARYCIGVSNIADTV